MQEAAHASDRKAVTIVLSGSLTKGGFDAGVFRSLAERNIKVVRIVAVSSGALNGTAYAAGVRSRQEKTMAEDLVTAWQDKAGWRDIFHVSLPGILRREGFLDHKKLRALLRSSIKPSAIADPAPIELIMVVAPLFGAPGCIGNERATTYTKVLSFGSESFDRQDRLEEVFTAAIASASFPGIFIPTNVPGVGPCTDGGLVDSTPIRYACRGEVGSSVDAILVIAFTPADNPDHHRVLRGRRFLSHMINMLFSERLYHDLREIVARNTVLAKLDMLARQWQWTAEEVSALKDALGFEHKRVIPTISIRPLAPLPGDPFSGFFSAADRRRYVEAGTARASQVLDQLGWR